MSIKLLENAVIILSFIIPGPVFAASAVLQIAQAENLPSYEEYKRRQQNRNTSHEAPPPEQKSSLPRTPAPSGSLYKFTDDYGITHYVESFDLVPPQYRQQFIPDEDEIETSNNNAPQATNVRELSEIVISSAGLGPDWTRIDELVVFWIGRPPLIKNDSLLLAQFQSLQNEYSSNQVEAWMTSSYIQLGREQENLNTLDVLYLIFTGQDQAVRYRDLLLQGRGTKSAGYSQGSSKLRGLGRLRYLISIAEEKDVVRQLLIVQQRNALAVIGFNPEDVKQGERLGDLIEDFMKRSMNLR